jgi:hypothetical protein
MRIAYSALIVLIEKDSCAGQSKVAPASCKFLEPEAAVAGPSRQPDGDNHLAGFERRNERG